MKAATDSTDKGCGCVPDTGPRTGSEVTGCDHVQLGPFFMVIEEYLMMCGETRQTHKDIRDSEVCREGVTWEVSSLP